ncbi:ribosomal protein S5 domain 2-type protein, partial [Phakopsora pachyrhizi]
LKRSKPIKFLETFFSNNQDHRKGPIRLDGRSINDLRQLKKNLGLITSAHGSASVSIGNTSCITGIKFELSEPELKRPNQGFLITNVDIGPICSPKFRPGPPNDLSQAIASRLYDVLISSKVIPLNSLVIKSGLAVWVLHIDVVCLSHDGNIFDTALLSILAALENARKPVVEYDFDREQVILSNLKTPGMVPLKLNLSLFPVSFAIFQETKILVDPNLFEEENSSGQITVVLDLKDGQICHLWYA